MKKLYAVLISSLLTAPAWAQDGTRIFVDIPGIPGEALEFGYENQIVAEAWSQGVAALDGRSVVLPLRFTHKVDRASPLLVQAAITGARIPEVTLAVTRASNGGANIEFFSIELEQVGILSVETAGSRDDVVLEEVALSCSRYIITYFPQNSDGTQDTPVMSEGACGVQ